MMFSKYQRSNFSLFTYVLFFTARIPVKFSMLHCASNFDCYYLAHLSFSAFMQPMKLAFYFELCMKNMLSRFLRLSDTIFLVGVICDMDHVISFQLLLSLCSVLHLFFSIDNGVVFTIIVCRS